MAATSGGHEGALPMAGEPIPGLEPPLVDAHAHIWGADMPYAETAWTHSDYDFPVEDYLAMLDLHGVAHGVIAAASLFGTYSDYTIESLRAHPRLRGTVAVDPGIDTARLRAIRDAGVVGIRLQWFFKDPLPDLGGSDYAPLLARLRDLDMHVHINIDGAKLPRVLPPLIASGVKTVVDHFGWPDARLDPGGAGLDALVRAGEAGQVWVKLSSGFRFDDPGTAHRHAANYIARFGTDRLFWGSDAPFVGWEDRVSYADTLRLFAEWVPDAGTRHAIGETAYRFYFG
ncbi:MAG: amidohydrolase family protein [Sphingomonas sp.]